MRRCTTTLGLSLSLLCCNLLGMEPNSINAVINIHNNTNSTVIVAQLPATQQVNIPKASMSVIPKAFEDETGRYAVEANGELHIKLTKTGGEPKIVGMCNKYTESLYLFNVTSASNTECVNVGLDLIFNKRGPGYANPDSLVMEANWALHGWGIQYNHIKVADQGGLSVTDLYSQAYLCVFYPGTDKTRSNLMVSSYGFAGYQNVPETADLVYNIMIN